MKPDTLPRSRSRRRFLGSLGLGAGAHLLGSMVDQMLPEALGAASPVRPRFVLFVPGHGFVERHWSSTPRSTTDWDLNPILAPLAPWKNKMVIASKFFNPHGTPNLHGNSWATLTVTPVNKGPGGMSIDRRLAQDLGKGDAISSVALGFVSDRGGVACGSADGAGKPFPATASPQSAFEAIFGGGTPPGASPTQPGPTRGQELDRSVLDFVVADMNRLNARLAAPERAKLDQYLTSVRAVEQRLKQTQSARSGCAAPKGGYGANLGPPNPATMDAHLDIAFAALQCGLTHVVHISIEGVGSPMTPYGWLNDPRNMHRDHHDYNYGIISQFDGWISRSVATMARRMSEFQEAGTTMLDQSLILWMNACGGRHHNGQSMHPVIFLGGAGGRLRGGQYVQYPSGQRAISDAFVTAANALGVPMQKFGDTGICKGPLAEVLA